MMAMEPNFGAERLVYDPQNLPMGVLANDTITGAEIVIIWFVVSLIITN